MPSHVAARLSPLRSGPKWCGMSNLGGDESPRAISPTRRRSFDKKYSLQGGRREREAGRSSRESLNRGIGPLTNVNGARSALSLFCARYVARGVCNDG